MCEDCKINKQMPMKTVVQNTDPFQRFVFLYFSSSFLFSLRLGIYFREGSSSQHQNILLYLVNLSL